MSTARMMGRRTGQRTEFPEGKTMKLDWGTTDNCETADFSQVRCQVVSPLYACTYPEAEACIRRPLPIPLPSETASVQKSLLPFALASFCSFSFCLEVLYHQKTEYSFSSPFFVAPSPRAFEFFVPLFASSPEFQ